MLISRRREGETLWIGDNIEVRIVSVRGKRVILGIVAPREVKIAAAKLTEAELTNTAAAVHSTYVDRLVHGRTEFGESAVLLFGAAKEVNGRTNKDQSS
jgi:carbon storage regulator